MTKWHISIQSGLIFGFSPIIVSNSLFDTKVISELLSLERVNELKINKLEHKINKKVRTLSGGERRKVDLIRAL